MGRKNELVKCSVEAVEDQVRDRSSDFWQSSETRCYPCIMHYIRLMCCHAFWEWVSDSSSMPVYLACWQSRIYKLYVSSLHLSLFYGTSVPFVLDNFANRSYLQKMQQADALDDFFSQYPSVSYNRNVSSTQEFYRMRKQFNQVKNDRDEYPPESQAAWHSFRIAIS